MSVGKGLIQASCTAVTAQLKMPQGFPFPIENIFIGFSETEISDRYNVRGVGKALAFLRNS